MPIRRWHGWCAICKECGQEVLIDGEHVAYKEKCLVREAVMDGYFSSNLEAAIADLCGCRKSGEDAPGVPPQPTTPARYNYDHTD